MANGEDFAALASTYCDDGTRSRAGYLGEFKPGKFPKAFELAVNSVRPNETTQVVETAFGFHIAKRLP